MLTIIPLKINNRRCFVSLLNSKTPRQLQSKLKLLGFELIDLLFVFLYLSISNFIFGQTTLKPPLVYIGSLALALTLYFTKRGKPENYLQDKLSNLVNPSLLSANLPDTKYQPYFKRETYEKTKNHSTYKPQ